MTLNTWCANLNNAIETEHLARLTDKEFKIQHSIIQKKIINAIRRLDPVIVEWEFITDYTIGSNNQNIWINIEQLGDGKAAHYDSCNNSLSYSTEVDYRYEITELTAHEVFHSIFNETYRCFPYSLINRSILNRPDYQWPSYSEINKFALNKVSEKDIAESKIVLNVFKKSKIPEAILETLSSITTLWWIMIDFWPDNKYRKLRRHKFEDSNEIMARTIWSLYSLNFGLNNLNNYVLSESDLQFLEKFTYKWRKMFIKWIEKYRIWLKMKRKWKTWKEIEAKLLDAESIYRNLDNHSFA